MNIYDFISDAIKEKLKDYMLIDNFNKLSDKNYVKFINKRNFEFNEGGFVIDINEPIITILRWDNRKKFNIDTNYYHIFFKKNKEQLSQRNFFEKVLDGLNKKIYKIKNKNITN